jgi:drug/metabolite transporter (DMT)-like permease
MIHGGHFRPHAAGHDLLSFSGAQIPGVTYRKGDWGRLILLAFFEPCLYFIFEAAALSYTTASQASMITALCPVMVALAAASCSTSGPPSAPWSVSPWPSAAFSG